MGTTPSKQLGGDSIGNLEGGKPVTKLPLLLLDLGPNSAMLKGDNDETSPESGEESGGNDGPPGTRSSRSSRSSRGR